MGTAGSGRPRAKRSTPRARRTDGLALLKIGSGTVGGPSRFASFALLLHSARKGRRNSFVASPRDTLPLQVSLLPRPSFSFLLSSPPFFLPSSFNVVAPPSFFDSSSVLLAPSRSRLPPFFLSRSYVRRSPTFLSSSSSFPPMVRHGARNFSSTTNTQPTGYHRARSPKERAAERVIRCLAELLRRQTDRRKSKGHRSNLPRSSNISFFSSHRAPSFAESTIVEARLRRAPAISLDVRTDVPRPRNDRFGDPVGRYLSTPPSRWPVDETRPPHGTLDATPPIKKTTRDDRRSPPGSVHVRTAGRSSSFSCNPVWTHRKRHMVC